MGSYLITETTNRRHELSLSSYDRLFPNQDTMPRGGFGNLIALPLQYDARQHDNSVFVDDRFVPYSDQWAFLASIRRMSLKDVEALAGEGMRRSHGVGVRFLDEDAAAPWNEPPSRRNALPRYEGPLPAQIKGVLASVSSSRRLDYPRRCSTASNASRPFRTQSSTSDRRCDCPRPVFRASSAARRISKRILRFHAAASRRSESSWPTTRSSSSSTTSARMALRSSSSSAESYRPCRRRPHEPFSRRYRHLRWAARDRQNRAWNLSHHAPGAEYARPRSSKAASRAVGCPARDVSRHRRKGRRSDRWR